LGQCRNVSRSLLFVLLAATSIWAPTGGYFLGNSDVEFEEVFMSFVFMVLHWPEPGRGEALAAGMREMRDLLLAKPGCVGVEPPYLTEDGSCLVGISTWESADAFQASGITLRPSDETVEGETRPRERFLLHEA